MRKMHFFFKIVIILKKRYMSFSQAIASSGGLNNSRANASKVFVLRGASSLNDEPEIGSIAPDFTGPGLQNEILSLSDVNSKVIMIDFWASWCNPCRLETPIFVKIYEKYHDKGLEIISVSLDRKDQKAAWVSAIEKDKLTGNSLNSILLYYAD